MAKKAPKPERPNPVVNPTESNKENKFFNDDLMDEVAHVADSEREVSSMEVKQQAEPIIPRVAGQTGKPMPVGFNQAKEEPRSVGRPKKKVALRDKKPKTTYFDLGTHRRIKILRAFSEVEVKDLILVSVIDFLDKYCDEEGRLTRAGEKHIENVMDKVYEEFGESNE